MGGCEFGLRSQFNDDSGNEQATDTLPCASRAIARISSLIDSCANENAVQLTISNVRRIRLVTETIISILLVKTLSKVTFAGLGTAGVAMRRSAPSVLLA